MPADAPETTMEGLERLDRAVEQHLVNGDISFGPLHLVRTSSRQAGDDGSAGWVVEWWLPPPPPPLEALAPELLQLVAAAGRCSDVRDKPVLRLILEPAGV